MRGKIILSMLLVCLFVGSIHADIIIMADVSSRTEGADRADDNRSDSSKLSVRASSNGQKSWIKFDLGGLDVSSLVSATLNIALHEGKSGDQQFDVSFEGKIAESKLTCELKTSRGTSKVTGTRRQFRRPRSSRSQS